MCNLSEREVKNFGKLSEGPVTFKKLNNNWACSFRNEYEEILHVIRWGKNRTK